MIDKLRPC